MSSTLSRSLFQTARSFKSASTLPLSRVAYSSTHSANHIQTRMPPLREGAKAGPRFKEFDLQDRVYAITGGGRGLGLAMGEALMEAGAKVHCLDRLDNPHPDFLKAKEHAESEYGGSIEYHQIDVRNDAEVNSAFAEIAGQHKRLDGLIAAAGINHLQSALEHSQVAMNEVMQINYNGVFNSATAAARQMFNYQQKGSIVLIASMSGLIANKGMTSPVYNSSKAAVVQLSRSLAMEWGRHGIRVNNICPGHIITPMVEQVFQQNPAARAVWEAENMLGRLAYPEEFRGAALFAMSDASSFMTGSTLVIDGGHTAW
ncbi:putative short chain dehydrogenase/oxidoreductase [Aspergillus steynii IBT 23096]|uniref:Putative short chain dehydrogenase/oxidoreductase n=1 Tax=Aspergillus steynii IBT 23096 TaxID=1392250 RepID=A0A2I2GDZ9_9EURO|nr:putative short chain dehydrogenase/oxidoreductase [Aspergillus steynii IBT 23096]PLB51090.1 putative short chain dehydrogenase/oxidoreductase [Aspergillus steynii IBT 23096]